MYYAKRNKIKIFKNPLTKPNIKLHCIASVKNKHNNSLKADLNTYTVEVEKLLVAQKCIVYMCGKGETGNNYRGIKEIKAR